MYLTVLYLRHATEQDASIPKQSSRKQKPEFKFSNNAIPTQPSRKPRDTT